MKTCFQTTTISSAMFITAMAANPLAVRPPLLSAAVDLQEDQSSSAVLHGMSFIQTHVTWVCM